MSSDELVKKLKERYNNIHPLLFARCRERARTDDEFFNFLEDLSTHNWDEPVKWDDENRTFSNCDLFPPLSDVDF